MFLAIYHPNNLLCPTKVLTHPDDIAVAVRERQVACGQSALAPGVTTAMQGDDTGLLAACQDLVPADYPHRQLHRVDGPPSYAHPSEAVVEYEQSGTDALCWLFVRGSGQLALAFEDALLVLECGGGDLVCLPAHTRHWFRPGPGQSCLIVHAARSAAGLTRRPTGSDLAQLFPGFGL